MNQVVLATTNDGKFTELARELAPLDVELLSLSSFPDIGEIAETESTFAGNALLKAHAVARATGHVAIADDSGLVVDALGGAPGVYSARYGDDWDYLPGENRDQRNIRKLLHAMRPYEIGDRGCHFVTVIAVASPGAQEMLCEGRWQGVVLEAPLGQNGFGYDPIFWDPELNRSAAELKPEEKNAVSHRGKAVRKLIAHWPAFLARVQRTC